MRMIYRYGPIALLALAVLVVLLYLWYWED
jgi:hypothetical protein